MSLSVQFFSLLAMIGTGIAAGAVMDMVGTGVSQTGKTSWIRRYAAWLEIICWILIGCGAFYVLFLVRDGAWRMYDPVAQVSGLLLYAAIFHKPFRFFGRMIILLILKPIWFILRLIARIIQFFVRVIIRILTVLAFPFTTLFFFVKKRLFKNSAE